MVMRILLAAAVSLAGMASLASAQTPTITPTPAGPVKLHGAGATFPAPLYQKWIEVYGKAQPAVQIDYDVVGSGEGVKRFLANTVDFGASDSAMSDEQINQAKAGATLVPATASILALAYNLPDVTGALKLSRAVYADIFLGKIRHWNDPRIQALNPDLKLPKQVITLVARQDGSGTTYAMSNHLSAVSEEWRKGPGTGTTINWPGVTMTARGNEGVAGRIKRSWGSFGYVEYGFAKRLGLPMIHLENKAGHYVEPSFERGQATLAANIDKIPANLRVFISDPDGEKAYPIISLSWLLLHGQYADQGKRDAIKSFVSWALADGQQLSEAEGYIPLPDAVATLARAAVDRVQ
ncbi:MAG: phosphate ABC transporter substrate-binding protein PstS [Candidatus Competibacteraceae bacterium]|nr:phosphate ABC transporter substrate-binding protein PstS [Candidatus Competibacteraceae bacterium]